MAKLLFSTMIAMLLLSSSVSALIIDLAFSEKHFLPSPAFGPDSIAFDNLNPFTAYVSISDGRVLQFDTNNKAFKNFAYTSPTRTDLCDGNRQDSLAPTCGKVLGLSVSNSDRILYAVDKNLGLFSINIDEGGLATFITNTIGNQPFTHLSDVDVDPISGDVYFIDRNRTTQGGGVLGRLIKYDPKTVEVTVITSGLLFPSGLAVSFDGNSVLIPQKGANNILKYYIKGPKQSQSEVITLPGTPRKVKRATTIGNYWVAINMQDVQSSITTPIAYQLISFERVLAPEKDLSEDYPNTSIDVIQEISPNAYFVGSPNTDFITEYYFSL